MIEQTFGIDTAKLFKVPDDQEKLLADDTVKACLYTVDPDGSKYELEMVVQYRCPRSLECHDEWDDCKMSEL